MLFTTDKQTLEDLNIFGRHGSDSVYTVFNRCATRGGTAVLEEMFRYPLSEEDAINRRSGIIRYFAAARKEFPFSAADFDTIEMYLNNTDERTMLSAQDQSVSKKLGNLIAVDVETAEIYKAITALAEMLRGLHEFINSLDLVAGYFYRPDAAAILALLEEPAFAPILNKQGKNKLSNATLVEYDVLFRFRNRETLQNLMRRIYYLDVYLSVAKVGQERKFIFPKALPKCRHEIVLEGVYHPQVKSAIPNSIHINPKGNVIFLTGANMAGKSTFMKSLSTALFLAHMGFPVAAEKMEFSVMDGIYTTINLPDNLGMGASHFFAEVLRLKKIARELNTGKNLFIVFDELFRGTNVKDAYEATIAITKAFATKINSLFVISTHIIEAADILKEACDNVRFLYLPTKMNGNQPVYTYTLEEGVTNDRHGMIIINNEGILEILEAGLQQRRSA